MTPAGGVFGLMGLSYVGFVTLLVVVVLIQIVALYMATTFAGLVAGPGRAFLALLGTVALSIPAIFVFLVLDLNANTQDMLTSLVNLGAGTVSIKYLYRSGFGLALLAYALSAAISLAAMSITLLVFF